MSEINGARYAYLDAICNLVINGEDITIVSADYAAPQFDSFRKEYAERFLSVGIAEQNMIAVACGIAMTGRRAIAYACAPFPVIVPFNQLKNAVSMMNLNISVVSAGTGFAVPEWGATHFNLEDISLIRTLPNFKIITPTDNIMGKAVAEYEQAGKGSLYIRFDKNAEGNIYENIEFNFNKGFSVLRDGKKLAVITNSYLTHRVLNLYDSGKADGFKLIDLYSLPFDTIALLSELDGITEVLTVEEHILNGGIGSAVLEELNGSGKNITRMGVRFKNGYPNVSGSREYFLKLYGLSDEDIATAIYEKL